MLAFDEALERVVHAALRLESQPRPLAACLGRTLAEDVVADLPLPPFDTTAMDGWAVRAAEAAQGAELRALGVVGAGEAGGGALPPGSAWKVMTGAPMPPESDAVVPVEKARELPGSRVALDEVPEPGQHVRRMGEVLAAGTMLLARGLRLAPAHIALAAVAGRATLAVTRRPRASVLVTGDEVVPPGTPPGPGQIRNSNGPMLAAALERAGAAVTDLGTVSDDRTALKAALTRALSAGPDLLLTSGGVSAGDFDLVRPVLEELGARILFHKVAIKPAKPVLLAELSGTLVFGLPGNPVSSAVAFDILVRPAVRRFLGLAPPLPEPAGVLLTADVRNKGPRLGFHPARVRAAGGALLAEPIPTRGSHDILAHARANALLRLAADGVYRAGETVPAYLAADDTVLPA